MRLLHYLEIQNFKRFGDKQRIELDHPAVLIGPNNCRQDHGHPGYSRSGRRPVKNLARQQGQGAAEGTHIHFAQPAEHRSGTGPAHSLLFGTTPPFERRTGISR